MKARGVKSKAALGFLTVLDDPEHGLFGGYLVLNAAGRPLEFHCTAPIKPNRAQQILYGPTLEPFLYGEQIGQTLVDKATIEPLVVCTDRKPALAVRDYVKVPVALVLAAEDDLNATGATAGAVSSGDTSGPVWRIDAAHFGAAPLASFQLGRNRLAVPQSSPQDQRQITERIAELAESFDLAEPFGRIREAIQEARRGGPSG